ncbi:dihydroxyacetone kinase subunit DhaK [Clostridioides difficile]|nr:dihydroxyacetone kinase subunit DhaK [Clostridioides difficile]
MKTKKFINNTEAIVDDMISGFVKAYPDKIEKLDNKNVVIRKKMPKDKVAVIIGNGSGHEPGCIGFIGENMLSANAYGAIFSAPSPDVLYDAIKACQNEKGVCVLISNHAGDVINSKMAINMAKDDDMICEGVILYDDIASAPRKEIEERRGTVGTIFNYKITSAFANKGYSLDEVVQMSKKTRGNTRTLAVATLPGTSPVTGYKMFEIAEDEIEIGMGVHGEAAAHNMKLSPCKEVVKVMCKELVEDMPYKSGDEVAVIINGCGQTTLMELLIFYNDVEQELSKYGIKTFKPAIGNFITTQEMGGISLSICKLDEEMKDCWAKETDAPYFNI